MVNAVNMVRVFAKDAKGKITGGTLITETASKTFSRDVNENLPIPPNFPKEFAYKIKHVFLPENSTLEDAEKAFDTLA